ncbi:MAG TPA: fasciclin domain-containing protein [Gillisia sp.]|nr:fasciclin domain-containing protein [Gillisia sp.]
MKLKKVLIIAILSGLAFTSCKDKDRETDDDDRMEMERMDAEREREAEMRAEQQRLDRENNVTARIQRNQNLTTFNEGWNRNRMSQNLEGAWTTSDTATTRTSGTTTAYTIFAPSNDAYAALTAAQRTQWQDTVRMDRNTASMNYLLVNQRVTAEQLKQQIQSGNGKYTIKTMQGENITASMEGDNIILTDAAGNKARVIESDNEGSNGVIHIIDKVLWPKDPTKNEAARTGTSTTGTTTTRTGTP